MQSRMIKLMFGLMASVSVVTIALKPSRRNYYSTGNDIFEKCLKVITTSEDKLSIAPQVSDISINDVRRFTLLMER